MDKNPLYHRLIYIIFKFLSIVFIVNAIGVLCMGLYLIVEAWLGVFEYGLHSEQHPGAEIFKSIDALLIGMVFLIFGISIQSFIKKPSTKSEAQKLGFHELFDAEIYNKHKVLLWQTFLTTLLFIFISEVFKEHTNGWELLLIPSSILIIAGALYLINKTH